MDQLKFRSNETLRTELAAFLNSNAGQMAIALGRAHNECKLVDPKAPEIESVRAHSQYLGSRAAYDFLYTLTQPVPVEQEIPDSTYDKDNEQQ